MEVNFIYSTPGTTYLCEKKEKRRLRESQEKEIKEKRFKKGIKKTSKCFPQKTYMLFPKDVNVFRSPCLFLSNPIYRGKGGERWRQKNSLLNQLQSPDTFFPKKEAGMRNHMYGKVKDRKKHKSLLTV